MRIVGVTSVCMAMAIVGLLAQNRPDFSGTWGTEGGSKPITVSGGVFNCGSECTITQTASTLTVSRPAEGQGAKPRDIVINLDSTSTATSPAKWDGDKLVLTRTLGPTKVVQTLSFEGGVLTVVSEASPGDVGPLKQTFVKKK